MILKKMSKKIEYKKFEYKKLGETKMGGGILWVQKWVNKNFELKLFWSKKWEILVLVYAFYFWSNC